MLAVMRAAKEERRVALYVEVVAMEGEMAKVEGATAEATIDVAEKEEKEAAEGAAAEAEAAAVADVAEEEEKEAAEESERKAARAETCITPLDY